MQSRREQLYLELLDNTIHLHLEPNIIDEQLITEEGVVSYKIATLLRNTEDLTEKIKIYKMIKELNLMNKKLEYIGDMWMMKNLVQLDLSMNRIQVVSHLDNLIHLRKLDLGYNKIQEIQGLAGLKNIEELNLKMNQIKVIEGIDSLENLQIFNIASNQIHSIENVVLLRNFKTLIRLNVEDNPVCNDDSFDSFVIALVPQIQFYNDRIISEIERGLAQKEHIDHVKQKELKETIEDQEERKALLAQEKTKEKAEAFVESLEGDHLFHKQFENDPDGQEILKLCTMSSPLGRSVAEIYDAFKQTFMEVTKKLFEFGKSQHSIRANEIREFETVFNNEKTEVHNEFKNLLEQCDQKKVKLFKSIMSIVDIISKETRDNNISDEVTHMISNVQLEVDQLQAEHKAIVKAIYFKEYRLHNNLLTFLKAFKNNLKDIDFNFVVEIVSNFEVLRKESANFNAEVGKLLRDHYKNEKNMQRYENIPGLYKILSNEEAMDDALMNSFGETMDVLYAQEDEINDRITRYRDNMCSDVEVKEVERHKLVFIQVDTYLSFIRDSVETVMKKIPSGYFTSSEMSTIS